MDGEWSPGPYINNWFEEGLLEKEKKSSKMTPAPYRHQRIVFLAQRLLRLSPGASNRRAAP